MGEKRNPLTEKPQTIPPANEAANYATDLLRKEARDSRPGDRMDGAAPVEMAALRSVRRDPGIRRRSVSGGCPESRSLDDDGGRGCGQRSAVIAHYDCRLQVTGAGGRRDRVADGVHRVLARSERHPFGRDVRLLTATRHRGNGDGVPGLPR